MRALVVLHPRYRGTPPNTVIFQIPTARRSIYEKVLEKFLLGDAGKGEGV